MALLCRQCGIEQLYSLWEAVVSDLECPKQMLGPAYLSGRCMWEKTPELRMLLVTI